MSKAKKTSFVILCLLISIFYILYIVCPDPKTTWLQVRGHKSDTGDYRSNTVEPKLFGSTSVKGLAGSSTARLPQLLCPVLSPHLVGEQLVNTKPINISDLEGFLPEVQFGGMWHPERCMARHSVAIIIPYRDREAHLGIFLRHMHPYLQRQQLDYRIFIVEQSSRSAFNRGMLFNIGFKEVEALTSGYYKCHVLSDVDLMPENDYGLYSCTYDLPRHLAVYVSKWNYGLFYDKRIGGALEICTEHYKKVNGFSNVYFGWGAEDDDFYDRLKFAFPNRTTKNPFLRYNKTEARFFMLGHEKSPKNKHMWQYYNRDDYKRVPIDGISTLDGTYQLLKITKYKLYTQISVDIDQIKTLEEYHKRAKTYFGRK